MQSVYMPKEIVVALENEKAFGPGYLLDENRLTQDFYFFFLTFFQNNDNIKKEGHVIAASTEENYSFSFQEGRVCKYVLISRHLAKFW